MNKTMTQQVCKKLSECNRCRDAGFPTQIIGFVKTDKVKPDFEHFWKSLNEDLSRHAHKTVLTEIREIEEKVEKPPTRPPMEGKFYPTNDKNEMMFRMFLTLEYIAETLKNSRSYMGVKQ